MKEGWEYKRFDELMTPAKVERCGGRKDLPVLSITMHGGIVKQKERFNKTIASTDTSNYKVVKDGQLVIAFPIDEGLLYTQDVAKEGIMSPAYNIWDVDYTKIDRKYLVSYFHSRFAFSYYKAKLRGSTQRRRSMDKADLLSMPIPVPSLDVQKHIVSELDLLNRTIEKQKAQLEELDKLAQSIFYDMFKGKEWEKKTLKAITSKMGSGATPRGGNQSYKASGISLIRSLNVHNNEFLYDDLAFIDNEQANQLNNVIIEKGDVLLNITGASVARCCLVPDDVLPARVNQHVCIIRPISQINNVFLCHFLISKDTQIDLLNLSRNNAATREALPKGLLEKFLVPLPPLSLQQEFASKVEAIESMKAKVRQSLKEAETLFNSRMDYYFN